jgi:DNA-directed RNA polymerase subunit RPC12/RpoP
MVSYKCFSCGKMIGSEYLRTKVRCPYCGSKLLYKERKAQTNVKAR